MPTPFEILTDPLTLVAMALYGALIAWEAAAPARVLPKIGYWKLKGLAAFFAYLMIASYLPLVWDKYLAAYQLFDLSAMGPVAGFAIGLLVYELLVYAWHRGMHNSDVLWRGFHQMHHSAERLDTFSAFWFSPMDMAGFTLVGSLALVLVVGISPEAVTAFLLVTQFLAIFQHMNIRTPHWLGYIVQRPESHTIHHGRGLHRYNYSDLPIIDMLFGTFRNPRGYEHETGFYDGASRRVPEMLAFRDVSRPKQVALSPAE